MSQAEYDIVTVGGGLGGAAVAVAMAKAGARVLVVERETRFQDRIRGVIVPGLSCAELWRIGSEAMTSTAWGRVGRFRAHRRLPTSRILFGGWTATSR